MPKPLKGAPQMPPGWGVAYLDRFVWDGDTGFTVWPDVAYRCFLAVSDAEAGSALREQFGSGGSYHSGEWMDRGRVSMAHDGMMRGGKGLEITIDGHGEFWSWSELGAIVRRNLRSGRWPNAGQYHIRARYRHIAEYGEDIYPRYDEIEALFCAHLHPTCYPPEGASCLLNRRRQRTAAGPTNGIAADETARQLALF